MKTLYHLAKAQDGLDIGLLVARLFLGLRLLFSVLKIFIDTALMEDFRDQLTRHGIGYPAIIAFIIFSVIALAAVSLILGWKTKWFCSGISAVCLFIIIVFPAKEYFTSIMPPFATMVIAGLFIVIPVGRYILGYKEHGGIPRTKDAQ